MAAFTHFNEQGHAKMVDITEKTDTVRTAVARTSVTVSKEIYEQITNRTVQKGDVLAVAQVAGIMAAKKNSRDHSDVSSAHVKRGGYSV